MSIKSYQFYYFVTYDGGTMIATPNGEGGTREYTVSGGTDDVLNNGEGTLIQDPDPMGGDYPATYVGTTPDGGMIFSSPTLNSTHFVYLTDTPIPDNSPIPVSEAPGIVCFLAGTLVATPEGATQIEMLLPGDLVLTANGGAAPVKWLFQQTVSTVFADPARVAPVRISQGALGENLPLRDLLVSGDHALYLDGALVQAGALVNGSTVVRERNLPQTFVYYHVELADHALILAEGVAAETFVDNVGRRAFDNWRAYEAIHGVEARPIAELDLPRVKSARQLPAALRARLAA
jgi:hypothetical protein